MTLVKNPSDLPAKLIPIGFTEVGRPLIKNRLPEFWRSVVSECVGWVATAEKLVAWAATAEKLVA